MKIKVLMVVVAIFLSSLLLAVKDITLDEEDIIDLEKTFDKNEVFFKSAGGIETDGLGNLYYLATERAIILKLDLKTFKLVQTISSKGQGPGQLNYPFCMRIKDAKIFVWDMGFGGIKIFDLDGTIIKEFRFYTLSSIVFGLYNAIDFSTKKQIYARHIDGKNGRMISVFDLNGKLLRQLIPMKIDREKNTKQWFLESYFNFILDSRDNILMLQNKKGVLKKYNSDGNLIWESDLYADLPKNVRVRKKFKVNKSKGVSISYSQDFVSLCLLNDDKIFVSGVKIGLVYDKFGKLMCLIRKPDRKGFGNPLAWVGEKLYSPYNVYNLKNIWR